MPSAARPAITSAAPALRSGAFTLAPVYLFTPLMIAILLSTFISDGHLKHTQVTTLPYPGFPTDMQPQMAVLLGIAEGTSTVTESIFENRFKYVDELTRMGADIKVESNIAIISGVKRYTGARVNAPDLRAGAALVIAGLAADGITVVDDIYYDTLSMNF